MLRGTVCLSFQRGSWKDGFLLADNKLRVMATAHLLAVDVARALIEGVIDNHPRRTVQWISPM